MSPYVRRTYVAHIHTYIVLRVRRKLSACSFMNEYVRFRKGRKEKARETLLTCRIGDRNFISGPGGVTSRLGFRRTKIPNDGFRLRHFSPAGTIMISVTRKFNCEFLLNGSFETKVQQWPKSLSLIVSKISIFYFHNYIATIWNLASHGKVYTHSGFHLPAGGATIKNLDI